MQYVLQIGSNIYDFQSLDYEKEASLDSKTANAILAIGGSTKLPAIGDAVTITKVIRGTKLTKWTGKVTRIQFLMVSGDKSIFKMVAFDKKFKIQYLPPDTIGYASTKGSTMVKQPASSTVGLINPNSSTDLTAGTIDTTDSVLDTVDFGKGTDSYLDRKSALELVQMLSDRDVYVHPDGTTDFIAGAGTDRHTTHIFEIGGNCELDSDVGYISDDTHRTKRVSINGQGVGNVFISGNAQDGAYTAADKARTIEIPSIASSATAALAAANALAEVNRVIKYAKIILDDNYSVDYDVFDTIRLKGKLPAITIDDSTMKIFNIKVTVSGAGDRHETVDIILHNFRRAIWAKLVDPLNAANEADKNTSLSMTSTTVQNQIGLAGGSSVVDAAFSGVITHTVVTGGSYTNLTSFILNSDEIAGAHFFVDMKITVHFEGASYLFFRLFDGVSQYYPDIVEPELISFTDGVGEVTHKVLHLYVPVNIKSKTMILQALLDNGLSEVEVEIVSAYYTIGEHQH